MAQVALYPGKGLQEIAKKLMDHPDGVLGLCNLANIAYLFREEAKKRDGKPVLWEMKKASDEVRGLVQEEIDLILTIPADEWEKLDETDQEALVHEALCSINVKEDEKSGGTKFSVVKPNFQGYRENLRKYGAWREDFTEAKNILNAEAAINAEFGFSDGAQPSAEA